jgi:hypothetical protein
MSKIERRKINTHNKQKHDRYGNAYVNFVGVGHVAHRFLLCFVFCFDCLHPVSCVLNVTSVSGLSILDCPFRFV